MEEGVFMTINKGRFTTVQEEGAVVFIIGMRINKLFKLRQWLPVMMAFPQMIRELETNKTLGYMNSETFITGRTILSVQYWKSSDDLIDYARGQKHLNAWKKFNKKAREAGDGVGLYHETHIIQPGHSEVVYNNMPEFGLGKAHGIEPVTKDTHTAAQRLSRN